nr:MAG TPA: hypothetical protein [Caudoviricetes sp.]
MTQVTLLIHGILQENCFNCKRKINEYQKIFARQQKGYCTPKGKQRAPSYINVPSTNSQEF